MQRLYDELNKDGFEIIAVDLMEDEKVVRKFLIQNNLTFPVLLDKRGKVGALYGVRSIPTTYLIDKEGYIIARQIGAREWDTAEIQSVFKEILRKDK
jgi:peroxiredoxin